MFKDLNTYMHFCSVIWDKNKNCMIAGVTEPNSEYIHLYYRYTKKNHKWMFSNNEEILKKFCDEIQEMPNNSYMKDGYRFRSGASSSDIKNFKDNLE